MTTIALAASSPALTTPASRRRNSIACNIGAAFEWYDLVLYGLFAVVLSKQFFPTGDSTTAPALLAELFPARNHTSGVSISYVLGQLCFGGITPLIATWLVAATGNPAAPGLYLVGAAILSLGCLWACRLMGVR